MSEPTRKRVFILGAGCSVKSGYLLRESLASQLDGFYGQIPSACTNIQKSVRNTLNLIMGRPTTETLDQLAKDLEDKLTKWSIQRPGGVVDPKDNTQQRTDTQIRDAKIATSAMFAAREDAARQTGLPGYGKLLDSVFGGDPWGKAIAESDCHVLSFNYDRLFEIAFLSHFRISDPQHVPLYEQTGLNCGFDQLESDGYHQFKPKVGRFCFLKLHGSALWWVKKTKGENTKNKLRCYWPAFPLTPVNLHEIEKRLQGNNQNHFWEPLIAFPHEKHRETTRETGFEWAPYLNTIEKHTISVLKSATEVKIIGYSFAPIDSRHVMSNLLDEIPENAKIIVKNTDIPTVRARLEAYPKFKRRIDRGMVEFDPTPF